MFTKWKRCARNIIFSLKKEKEKRKRWRSDLANEGAVRLDPSVAPWDHPEIDDGDETVLEDLRQIVHYEIGTVRTQSFVVQSHRNILGLINRLSWGNEREQCVCDNKNGEDLTRTHLWAQKKIVEALSSSRYGYGVYCGGGTIRMPSLFAMRLPKSVKVTASF